MRDAPLSSCSIRLDTEFCSVSKYDCVVSVKLVSFYRPIWEEKKSEKVKIISMNVYPSSH